VQTPLDFGDELLGTSTEDECASLCFRTAFEKVESFAADLPLLELLAGTKVFILDI
jgi:hypothetical protein